MASSPSHEIRRHDKDATIMNLLENSGSTLPTDQAHDLLGQLAGEFRRRRRFAGESRHVPLDVLANPPQYGDARLPRRAGRSRSALVLPANLSPSVPRQERPARRAIRSAQPRFQRESTSCDFPGLACRCLHRCLTAAGALTARPADCCYILWQPASQDPR
jgi:hypothetical protein